MSDEEAEVDTPAVRALRGLGIEHLARRYPRAASLAEAAAQRGLTPGDIVKSMVIRRGSEDYLFVLLPGDREISWPKLRALLGVSRLSMPSADDALRVTGYPRGTITPFGSLTSWPVVMDSSLPGRAISMGGGDHGVAIALLADDIIEALKPLVADISEPVGD